MGYLSLLLVDSGPHEITIITLWPAPNSKMAWVTTSFHNWLQKESQHMNSQGENRLPEFESRWVFVYATQMIPKVYV